MKQFATPYPGRWILFILFYIGVLSIGMGSVLYIIDSQTISDDADQSSNNGILLFLLLAGAYIVAVAFVDAKLSKRYQ
jgi:vacuolar-type H+-ATPase subunit I/STV1